MELRGVKIRAPRVESLGDGIRLLLLIASPYIFWVYSTKFLGMSAEYLTSMSRDITVLGVQKNLSFYPMDKLMLFYGGMILLCFLLIKNEFRNLLRAASRLPLASKLFESDEHEPFDWSSISTSLFAIASFIISYFIMVHLSLIHI